MYSSDKVDTSTADKVAEKVINAWDKHPKLLRAPTYVLGIPWAANKVASYADPIIRMTTTAIAMMPNNIEFMNMYLMVGFTAPFALDMLRGTKNSVKRFVYATAGSLAGGAVIANVMYEGLKYPPGYSAAGVNDIRMAAYGLTFGMWGALVTRKILKGIDAGDKDKPKTAK
jgi:hypothetical protein